MTERNILKFICSLQLIDFRDFMIFHVYVLLVLCIFILSHNYILTLPLLFPTVPQLFTILHLILDLVCIIWWLKVVERLCVSHGVVRVIYVRYVPPILTGRRWWNHPKITSVTLDFFACYLFPFLCVWHAVYSIFWNDFSPADAATALPKGNSYSVLPGPFTFLLILRSKLMIVSNPSEVIMEPPLFPSLASTGSTYTKFNYTSAWYKILHHPYFIHFFLNNTGP